MQAIAPRPASGARRCDAALAALINPASFRMRIEARAARTAATVRAHAGAVFEVNGLADIHAALENACRPGLERLIIAGGDGTLQAAVTWLAEHYAGGPVPELIVLAAGRTNYVAADIGTGRHFQHTLETILEHAPDRLQPIRRQTLVLSHPDLGRQHGFFVAGASLDEIIRWAHARQPGPAARRWAQYAASTTATLGLLARWSAGRFRFRLPRLDIEADGLGRLDGACRFLLLTSLPLDGHLVRPYARRGRGALRVTAIAAPARRLALRLPGLLCGRFGAAMRPDQGYLSGRAPAISIRGIDAITLDGQEFDLDPACPLQIESGPTFRFLRP